MINLIRNGLRVLKKYGLKQFMREVFHYMRGRKIHYSSKFFNNYKNNSTNIYEKDWDVLLILDACRYDLFQEVINNYDFILSDDYIYSTGSSSDEWMKNTFIPEYQDEISKTSYITGNIFSEYHLDGDNFYNMVELWKEFWDEEEQTIPPNYLTDYAIQEYRNNNPEKMIVHYMQPHQPFIGSDVDLSNTKTRKDVNQKKNEWDKFNKGVLHMLRDGELEHDAVWKAYKDNLEFVMNEVDKISNNLDCDKLIITADHGNSFGENGIYGHPAGVPTESLRKVPWIEIETEDKKTVDPDIDNNEVSISNDKINERLENLGYK
jgi:hypothetical protein